MIYDYLVVGAGLFGCVIAERIANDPGCKVLVIDKRPHIGGICYSEVDDATGIEVHKYGTHIFHTSSKKAWDYVRRFTGFNGYRHQVLTTCENKVYQMPINLETINSFYNLNLKPQEAKELLRREIEKEQIIRPMNLEEQAISMIGRPLYEALIKGYTIKQWGKNPTELPPEIITRLPVRFDYREDYFLDARWQGIPCEGYTKMFEKMLSSPNIDVKLNCDYFDHQGDFKISKQTIYTGTIDRYFDYRYGKLQWRAVKLKKKVLDVEDYQGTSVMNYADVSVKYTRIHEPKHLHPERNSRSGKTVVFYEYPMSRSDDPYYPVNTREDQILIEKYKNLSRQEKGIIIAGRLGNYNYLDMDKTILTALKCYEDKIAKK